VKPGNSDPERALIAAELSDLEGAMLRLEKAHTEDISSVHRSHRLDAVNLIHYLALRQTDVRLIQRKLGARGLSSLGRCEPHVMATLESVRAALDGWLPRRVPEALSFDEGRRALDRNTDSLFGPRPEGRVTRIMVTLPTEAAANYPLVRRLVASGMDIARINGAHDEPLVWEQMAANVRRASAELGRSCRVSMDLSGPKLRTGPLTEGPLVKRFRPLRDLRGVPIAPALVTLEAGTADQSGARGSLRVDAKWMERRQVGDIIVMADTRGSPRELQVVKVAPNSVVAELWDTTYMETGATLECKGDTTVVGPLKPLAQFHVLQVGDTLVLTRSLEPAVPWRPGQPGRARLGCTLPAVFDVAKPGQQVVLDDGKIIGLVDAVSADEIEVRITEASPQGSRLRAEKGINFPETEIPVGSVSDADLPLLRVAAAHADMVAPSFLRHEHDVDDVLGYLRALGAQQLGLVLKIETRSGFGRLPEILLHAMRSPWLGVMIARGDLAVEAGYERLAEMQEEIMWLCEAAHVPVIWATEVLDRLARTGRPSRAEVTDAAMAQRAEAVMLNKGPHIDTAIVVLDDILRRMSGHQRKKAALLRPLRSWEETA
jgi:pyruvate kinase